MADQTTGELTLESVAKYAQETAILAKASEEHMNEMQDWLDILWLLLGSYLVFFMQVCETPPNLIVRIRIVTTVYGSVCILEMSGQ